jgi:hypothetical protein
VKKLDGDNIAKNVLSRHYYPVNSAMCKRRMEDFKGERQQKNTTQEEKAESLKGANRLPVLHPMMVKPCFQSPPLSHFPCPCPDRCMEPTMRSVVGQTAFGLSAP